MMAIDFVVRDNAGGVQRGTISQEAQNQVIQAGSGQEISLNLSQVDLVSQVRDGNDLIISLADGRVINISNYFNEGGAANRLFLSTDGYLNEVTYVEQAGGALHAQYGPTEQWGKWNPSDDLIFLGRTDLAHSGVIAEENEVSMLGAALLGGGGLGLGGGAAVAAGVVGGGAVLGSLSGSGESETGGDGEEGTAPIVSDGGETGGEGDGDEGDGDGTGGGDGSGGGDGDGGEDGGDGDGGDGGGDGDGGEGGGDGDGGDGGGDGDGGDGGGDGDGGDGGGDGDGGDGGGDGDDGDDDDDDDDGDDGGDGGTPDHATPYVNDASSSTNLGGDDSSTHTLTVTGGGEPGTAVQVVVGDKTLTTVINSGGTFEVTFEGDDFPEDGTHEAVVNFGGGTDGGTVSLDGPGYVIDTVAPFVEFTQGTDGVGDFFNEVSFGNGVTLNGTGEPGATVEVTVQGITRTATVAQDGSFSVHWQAGTLVEGEYSSEITVKTSDSFGNTRSSTETLVVDTVAEVAINDSTVEIDGVVSAAEREADGVDVTGTSQPGSSVEVTMNGATRTVTADSSGNWTANFATSEVPTGELMVGITAVATDGFGNKATATGEIEVDTIVTNLGINTGTVGGDGVINAVESNGTLIVTGTTEVGSTSVVVAMGEASVEATVDAANGTWSAVFPSGSIEAGTYQQAIDVTAKDAVGNVGSVTQLVQIDTEVVPFTNTSTLGGQDGVLNAAEAAVGMQLGGSVEVGSKVVVNFGGKDYNATVSTTGDWSVNIPASGIAAGDYDAPITITATDKAMNVAVLNDTLSIDTLAPGAPSIVSQNEGRTGYEGISTRPLTDTDGTRLDGEVTEVFQAIDGGSVTKVVAEQNFSEITGKNTIDFASEVPDGSHLIVTNTDAAGNTSGTYMVLDDSRTGVDEITLSSPALGNYQIESIDLGFAEDAHLTINEETLVGLSTNSNELLIRGGSDDRISIAGGVKSTATHTGDDGATYDVYDVGEGVIYVDPTIDVNII